MEGSSITLPLLTPHHSESPGSPRRLLGKVLTFFNKGSRAGQRGFGGSDHYICVDGYTQGYKVVPCPLPEYAWLESPTNCSRPLTWRV